MGRLGLSLAGQTKNIFIGSWFQLCSVCLGHLFGKLVLALLKKNATTKTKQQQKETLSVHVLVKYLDRRDMQVDSYIQYECTLVFQERIVKYTDKRDQMKQESTPSCASSGPELMSRTLGIQHSQSLALFVCSKKKQGFLTRFSDSALMTRTVRFL